MSSGSTEARASRRRGRWLPWLTGAALLAAVCYAAVHWSDAEQAARIAERAEPWWLLVAVVLQLLTYVAQGRIWGAIGAAAKFSFARGELARLSVAKLFVDQALPMAGLGGTAAVSKYLEERGLAKPAVFAGVVINVASYFAVYVLLLVAALLMFPLEGAARAAALGTAGLFIAGSLLLIVMMLVVPGRTGILARLTPRRGPLARLSAAAANADIALLHDPGLLAVAAAWQAAIVLCDAATMLVLLRALGSEVAPASVFASFMISNLFRSMGILPGGLGTFEASSVFTLQLASVPLAAALSATLLFRGLSFWLPMIPGAWLSRRMFRSRAPEPSTIAGWEHLEPGQLMQEVASSPQGLTRAQAEERLQRHGPNRLREERAQSPLRILRRQFASPLLLMLLFAAAVAAFTGETADAVIVASILFASALIGYRREYQAHNAAEALRARIRIQARVLRDGSSGSLAVEELVPGDVVLLAAGSLVPADAKVLEATDCYVSESVLTGESFPVLKSAGDCVFLGTNVRSGTARCLVAATGAATRFGGIARRLMLRPPQTEFDRGILRFGYLLTIAMLVMVLLVFAVHMMAARPVIETLLFSVALAVGLSPELLPAILSVNLARGAEMLARRGVLVRHLNAIENLGSMDVLCTDKTGTLTEGVINLQGGFAPGGAASAQVIGLGALNAALESGLASPLDDAILASGPADLAGVRKLAEIPFDFVRKRVSVVIERDGNVELISKGAFAQVLDACSVLPDGQALDDTARAQLERRHAQWSGEGVRVLAVASRTLPRQPAYGRDAERDLVFRGFLTFLDRPKAGAAEALGALRALGIGVKLITGDARLVAMHVAGLVGMPRQRVLSGAELDRLRDEALWREAERTDLFVEVDPNQKERIILALKKMGHVVGFLGDGVNDAPAMHAADTSLSVEQAVDVAREAADFVLLQRDLEVIRRGVEEGRRTFTNTLKYILTTTSANLGNMISMALASLFLPFLPLTAGQILLNNFLSDIPAVGIAADGVDPELVERPRRWDIRFIGRFMVDFGLLSSLFDFLTFGALLWLFQASVEEFRSAWFVESLLTELVIALVVRTRRPFFRSRPGNLLLVSTAVLALLAPAIPYLPFARELGFVPMPGTLLAVIVAVTACYVLAAELMKRWFYASHKR
ncbi:MAG TPA: magnesium-translocating P-type ATPase [Steroidobacteraceae bacterium]|nr:magnesium-translocating P-type ATPase [Steroidobacteraceae bacterium]